MTIVQFISAMERYSMDVLALAFLVCLITSALKKGIPQRFKKYITFLPFVIGIAVYAAYMYLNQIPLKEIALPATALKGIECGAAATIYYVLYEQFIRGKPVTELPDIRAATVRSMLKDYVREDALEKVSKYIAGEISGDDEFALNLCISAVSGNTKSGISDSEVLLIARLVLKTLKAI